jgi:hypothetical protein
MFLALLMFGCVAPPVWVAVQPDPADAVAAWCRGVLARAGFSAEQCGRIVARSAGAVRVDLDLARRQHPDAFLPGQLDAALGAVGLANAARLEIDCGEVLFVRAVERRSLGQPDRLVLSGRRSASGWVIGVNDLPPGWLAAVTEMVLHLNVPVPEAARPVRAPTLGPRLRRAERLVESAELVDGAVPSVLLRLHPGAVRAEVERFLTALTRVRPVTTADDARWLLHGAVVQVSAGEAGVIVTIAEHGPGLSPAPEPSP